MAELADAYGSACVTIVLKITVPALQNILHEVAIDTKYNTKPIFIKGYRLFYWSLMIMLLNPRLVYGIIVSSSKYEWGDMIWKRQTYP